MNDRADLRTDDDRAAAPTTTAAPATTAAPTTTATADQRIPTERGDVADTAAPAQTAAAPAPRSAGMPQAQSTDGGDVELLPSDALNDFRTRWDRVQVMFVDEPRDAVQQAHDLVDEVVTRLTESFSKQREGLMGTWTRGEDVSTEDLRVALQRYRSFFDRLLSA